MKLTIALGILAAVGLVLLGVLLFLQKTGTPKTIGQDAPDITAQAAADGQVAEFNLKQTLADHAVVLYFFPKAFTAG